MTVPASASSGDVFARERQEHIVRIVDEHGRVRVGELATRFKVSAVTIRKDLIGLESDGRLIRTHGGAIAIDRSPKSPSTSASACRPMRSSSSAPPAPPSSRMARAS